MADWELLFGDLGLASVLASGIPARFAAVQLVDMEDGAGAGD